MILGVGTDILQISRMQDALERTPRLFQRLLTDSELKQAQESANPTLFLAKRFAAKEAIVKALGTGIGRGVSWQHIEITKNEFGRPEVSLNSGALDRAKTLGINTVHLSYSDEKAYIVAFAIAED